MGKCLDAWRLAMLLPFCFSNAAASAQQTGYGYDALGRIVTVDRPSGNAAYNYDPADNRITVSVSPHVITGTAGPDILNGTYRKEQINALGGNDLIGGAGGGDTIDGGTGWDIAFYSVPAEYTFVRQISGAVHATYLPNGDVETLVNVEGTFFLVSGEAFPLAYMLTPDNIINGTSGDDTLNGGATSVDRLNGLAGNDFLVGGGVVDILDGGLGHDVAFYAEAPSAYSFVWVTMGSTPNAALHVTHTASGSVQVLIDIEGCYFIATSQYIPVGDLP